MKLIKGIVFFLVFFVFAGCTAYCKTVSTEVQFQTKDSRIIKATVSYNQIAGLKKYPTVVLLHSLGYSSKDWGNLISYLNTAGYAVIAVDLRGHGKSIYDGNFHQKSWSYFTLKTYSKFPSDVESILAEVPKQVKVISMDNMAMVGADIGANTAVLVSKDLKKKPKTLVLISPVSSFKGLYIPLTMTSLNMPILAMASKQDRYSMQQQGELAKFAQGGFYAQNYPNGGMGMMMINVNPSMAADIVKWINRYVH